jgi:hypothetical protein
MATRDWLPLTMILATLCGCAPVYEAQQNVHQTDLVAAHQGCLAEGLAPDTPEFTECVRQKLAVSTDLQHRSLEALQELAGPSRRIEPGAGQLCLPTASGLAVGNCP